MRTTLNVDDDLYEQASSLTTTDVMLWTNNKALNRLATSVGFSLQRH